MPETSANCTLATVFAEKLRESRGALVARWVERVADRRVQVGPAPPTPEMVLRMSAVVDGIAWYLEHPDDDIRSDVPLIRSAAELGMMRFRQGFPTAEILGEYGLLGRLLFEFLATTVEGPGPPCDRSALLVCGYRLFHAMRMIETAAMTHLLQRGYERVAEREGRLRAFNTAVSHEIKNRIGTVLNAGQLLCDAALPRERVQHFAGVVTRNAQEMRRTVDNLIELARVEDNPREQRHIPLRALVEEAVNQVQPSAYVAGVRVHVASVPDVEVNAAVHLLLANYMSNAIKYCDPAAHERHVRVDATLETPGSGTSRVVVHVRDNGLGVPPERRETLFNKFFRAHEERQTEGTGLGLSIVREVVTAIGGRAWAEFPEKGSVFSFAVPYQPSSTVRPPRERPHRRLKRRSAA